VIVALLFGIGGSLYSYDLTVIAAFCVIALIGSIFASAPKILMPLAGLCGFVMLRFFFFTSITGAWQWILAVVLGGAAYMLLPKKVLNYISNLLFRSHKRVAARHIINLNRSETAAKVGGAAGVFRSMAVSLEEKEASEPDYRGVIEQKCCITCDNYNACKGSEHASALDSLLLNVQKSGRAVISELPAFLSSKCMQLGRLMSAASYVSDQAGKHSERAATDKAVREVVSRQMRGMTEVLEQLARNVSLPVSANDEKEKRVLDELNYSGVAAQQVLLAGGDVSLIIRKESFDAAAVEKGVSGVLKQKCVISGVDDTALAGFYAVSLSLRPRYDVLFGVAAAPKIRGEASGDTHSFIRVGSDRFMIALCDGMGAGGEARKTGETAINLIESFYRAGFTGDTVLKIVNRFLTRLNGESFSAIDICVIDLNTGGADIIKLGSPSTHIKRRDTVDRIDGAAPPMGVLDIIEPSVFTARLENGDFIILNSDGVSDSFDGDKLSAAVNNLSTLNPKILAESVLEHTLHNYGGAFKDDSTVIAARLIEAG
jgi:stage II sporulation protein E